MARINTYKKAMAMLILPLVYGYFGVTFFEDINDTIGMILSAVSLVFFLLYWYYAGKVFSSLNERRLKNLILGNILWFISFLLFLWQFYVMHVEAREPLLDRIAQYYTFAFTLGAQIIVAVLRLFGSRETIILVGFILMLATFITGFVTEIYKKKRIAQKREKQLKGIV